MKRKEENSPVNTRKREEGSPVGTRKLGVKIIIHGVGGHSSSPHLAVNALVVAGQVIRALNTEVAYRFAAGKRPAITSASLSGGTAGNIIPSKAEIRYEIIVRGGEDIETIHRIFHKIPPGIAKIYGASCKVNFYEM